MNTHTHARAYTHTHMCMHINITHEYTYAHIHAYTQTHIYTHIHLHSNTHTYTHTHTHTHTHPEDSVNDDFIFPISTIPKLFVPLDPSGCQDLQEKRIKVRNGALLIYLFIPHLVPDGILGGSLRWAIQPDNNIPKVLSRAHRALRELPRSASPASSPAPSPCKHTSLHCCTSFSYQNDSLHFLSCF